jgi:hypothetical protein
MHDFAGFRKLSLSAMFFFPSLLLTIPSHLNPRLSEEERHAPKYMKQSEPKHKEQSKTSGLLVWNSRK